jgi:DHA1 family bicyclomycin/chloramphenicol resistance-like MFS transporter
MSLGRPSFINSMGLRPSQYGLIFSACFWSVMAGLPRTAARRLGRLTSLCNDDGIVWAATSGLLLGTKLVDWVPLTLVVSLLVAVGLALRIEHTDAMNATMHPLPPIAGAVGAVSGRFR